MKQIIVRSNGTKRVITINEEPSKTDQQYAKDCDVNEIMKKYIKTGQISHLAKKQGHFADASLIPDLLTATVQIQQAQELFSELPSNVRRRFDNNPTKLYQFLSLPENSEEAIALGLKLKKESTVSSEPPIKKEQPQG